MTEFITNQWYVDSDGNYYQYLHSNADYRIFRDAGSLGDYWLSDETLESLTPASLTPDFSDAKVGDMCFSAMDGVDKITEVIYPDIAFTVCITNGAGYDRYGLLCLDDAHPTLFNSFAQFMAYWAEEWLKHNTLEEK